MKIRVCILFGGVSNEHSVSVMSATNIFTAIDKNKYEIYPVYITRDGEWYLYKGDLEKFDTKTFKQNASRVVLSPDASHKGLIVFDNGGFEIIGIDICLPVLHGKNGEDGTMQGLFEIANIKYVGCKVLTSAVCMDKIFTKKVVAELDINQAKFVEANAKDLQAFDVIKSKVKELGYPVFVKPANAGSSVGVSKVKDESELEDAVIYALKADSKVLIEEAIIGREVECAVLGNFGDKLEISRVCEIISSKEFYDFDAKYETKSKTQIVEDVPNDVIEQIRTASRKIYNAVSGSGLSRVDFFIEKDTNKVYFNEINTFPGFTNISMYPYLLQDMGYEYSVLIDKLIELGLKA